MKYSEMAERIELCAGVIEECREECQDPPAKASLQEALDDINAAEQRLHHLGLVHFNTTDERKDDPDV